MRVLVLRPGPNFSVQDVCTGWVNAFQRLGCQVVDYNLDDRLSFYERALLSDGGEEPRKAFTPEQAVALASKGIEAACYEVWPDVVVIVSGFYVPEFVYRIMRARGHKLVTLFTESPYEDDTQLQRASWADVNIVNDPTNLERFQEINPNTHYFGHAYDPEIHHRLDRMPERESDFFFVGTGYPSRIEFFEQVDWSDVDAVFAGNWQMVDDESVLAPFLIHQKDHCLDNEQAVEFYSNTKASVNLYRREAQRDDLVAGYAMGPREIELAACETFYLTEPRGENRDVLPMIPTFSGPAEFSDKLRWYLARPETRADIARAARAAISDRTFTASAERLLRLLA